MSALPGFLPDRYVFFKSQTKTDLLLLDEEVSKIGTLIQDVCETAAQANEIRELAKDSLNEVYAFVCANLRNTPAVSGKVRSEAQIESEAPMDDTYKQAQGLYSEARLDAALWGSVVEGMRSKSAALKVTADLISQGFITSNFLLAKRREEIRNVVQQSS